MFAFDWLTRCYMIIDLGIAAGWWRYHTSSVDQAITEGYNVCLWLTDEVLQRHGGHVEVSNVSVYLIGRVPMGVRKQWGNNCHNCNDEGILEQLDFLRFSGNHGISRDSRRNYKFHGIDPKTPNFTAPWHREIRRPLIEEVKIFL